MTSEDVVKRIAAEGVFVDERRGVGIRLNPRDAPMLQAFLVRSALLIVAATLGGFAIGFVTQALGGFLPSTGSWPFTSGVYLDSAVFALVILVLLVRPDGLFVRRSQGAVERV